MRPLRTGIKIPEWVMSPDLSHTGAQIKEGGVNG